MLHQLCIQHLRVIEKACFAIVTCWFFRDKRIMMISIMFVYAEEYETNNESSLDGL